MQNGHGWKGMSVFCLAGHILVSRLDIMPVLPLVSFSGSLSSDFPLFFQDLEVLSQEIVRLSKECVPSPDAEPGLDDAV